MTSTHGSKSNNPTESNVSEVTCCSKVDTRSLDANQMEATPEVNDFDQETHDSLFEAGYSLDEIKEIETT